MVFWQSVDHLFQADIIFEHVVTLCQSSLIPSLYVVGDRVLPFLPVSVVVSDCVPGLLQQLIIAYQ